MNIKFKVKKVIELADWDKLVQDTYGKPYCFQQQEGCRDRGTFDFVVPSNTEDIDNTTPEVVNEFDMGVKFDLWLKRDPQTPLSDNSYFNLNFWWYRYFYPEFQALANDLYSKGLIEAGDYTINIDW